MAQASYNDIASHLLNLEEFKGNSMYAEWAESRKLNREVYRIKSYSTVIAEFDPETDTLHFNSHKYSSTTSRQQNMIKRAFAGFDTVELDS